MTTQDKADKSQTDGMFPGLGIQIETTFKRPVLEVIGAGFADEVLRWLQAQRSSLARYVESVKRREFSNAWADAILEHSGCEMSG